MFDIRIKTFGALEERQRELDSRFNWRELLRASDGFKKVPMNPNHFRFDAGDGITGNLYTEARRLALFPEHLQTTESFREALAKAVAAWYRFDCQIRFLRAESVIVVYLYARDDRGSFGIKTGSVLPFGRYPQGKGGEVQPIQWRVLTTDGQTATLMADACLMTSAFCDPKKIAGHPWYLAWVNSLAREVCNGRFFYEAFDEAERAVILPTLPDLYGSDTVVKDHVFLLSEEQVRFFLPDPEQRRAQVTDWLLSGTVKPFLNTAQPGVRGTEFASWWLLPETDDFGNASGETLCYPKAVWPSGVIQYHSRNVYHSDFVIRPCIRVKLNDAFIGILASEAGENLAETEPTPPADTGAPLSPVSDMRAAYSLEYIKSRQGREMEKRPGGRTASFDGWKWRMWIQLDEERIWFLSVFLNADGTFDKYSLDQELACDSHYEFQDEAAVRKAVYAPGDENRYFAEVLIRYVRERDGYALLQAIRPCVTAEFHYD